MNKMTYKSPKKMKRSYIGFEPRFFLCLTALVLLCSGISLSQTDMASIAKSEKATITGIVTDHSGSVIPGTKIFIIGTQTRETTTVFDGSYRIEVPSGIYHFRVENSEMGFSPTYRSPAFLDAGSTITMNFALFGHQAVFTDSEADMAGGIIDHPSVGPFRFDEIQLGLLEKQRIKTIGIRYGSKSELKDETVYKAEITPEIKIHQGDDYPGVLFTYDLSTIQARRIVLSKNGLITADGNVSIETLAPTGLRKRNAERIQLRIINGQFVQGK